MISEFYYSWMVEVVSKENTSPIEICDLVKTALEVLYGAYPHTIDLHLQVLIENSVYGQEIKILQIDFLSFIKKEEVEKLLVEGFTNFLSENSISCISKVIILGYTDVNPFE